VLTASIARPDDFDGWRTAARRLAAAGIAAEAIVWQVGDDATDLLGGDVLPPGDAPVFTVPKAFIDIARRVICHRDPERFALLYTALTTLPTRPKLLDDPADTLVRRLYDLDKSVRRDVHKMRAFVRFREVPDSDGERFAAWFEPEHHIVRLNAGFFARRFANMRWSILTPDECVHWDGELNFTPGATRADAPGSDPLEETWRTYFASIFNPARLKVKAMTAEMPKKYWKNLPEASLVPGLIAGAEERTRMMIAAGAEVGMSNDAVQAEVSADGGKATTIEALRTAAAGCKRCPLYLPATQTVFGEGSPDARLVFVGEQPGDSEDLAGRPFIGPAGQVFDRALAAAGIDRARAYVTNAVKHFKFEQRGKRRIHSKPGISEIDACRWWVDHERALIRPAVTVALGATAARSLTGKTVTISRERGRALTLADGTEAWITVHPSFLLRIEDRAAVAPRLAALAA
jgi:probable DNA metabolism protein